MSTYTPIASQTTTGSVAAIYFDNIPQTYTDLVIVMNTVATGNYTIALQFNGDTAGNYAWMQMWGPNGSAVNSENQANKSNIDQSSSGTTYGHACITTINSYSNPNVSKMVIQQAKDNVNNRVYMQTAPWRNTAAITSLVLSTSGAYIAAGSTFNLYGIQAGGGYATGGNIIVSDGTYWYHTFTSSGVFTPNRALICDYLVVAGGGGAGNDYSAGAGAGGYRTSIGGTALSLTASTSYIATVGAGGAGGTSGTGAKGSNSVFSTITSTGGGLSRTLGNTGSTGGSGSGGSSSSGTNAGGAGNEGGYSPVEGYAGGSGTLTDGPTNNFPTGGGGGAGAVGGNGTGSQSGAGGVGVSNSINGTATYYAGGGGGGGYNGASSAPTLAGAGGNGGGGAGNGGSNGAGTSGTTNTGGGGGGGSGAGGDGGSGGSGIVIVRYAV